jgi:hypothetical protein
MSRPSTWNTTTIAEFNALRDKRLAKDGMGPFSELSPSAKASLAQREKKSVVNDEKKALTLQVSSVDGLDNAGPAPP